MIVGDYCVLIALQNTHGQTKKNYNNKWSADKPTNASKFYKSLNTSYT